MEQFRRTLVKGISWRILGTLSTVVLVIIMTGELTLAVQLGAVDIIIKFLLYMTHERLWGRVKWGLSDRTDKID